MSDAIIQPEGSGFRVNNIYCIGRNYVEHIEELGNSRGSAPIVFLKPSTAVLRDGGSIELPSYSSDVHHEVEVVVLIGQKCRHIGEDDALTCVAGYGVGLDLTARDVQNELKDKGLPWTQAKCFATSACLSDFVAATELPDPSKLIFELKVNGQMRQTGDAAMMIYSIPFIVSYLSDMIALEPGDLIFTGTPKGVAAIHPGDTLEIDLMDRVSASFTVTE